MKRNFTSTLFLAIGAFLGLAAAASAGTLNLSDQNSSVAINTTSPIGLSNWTINGQNIATQQWFYYAIGTSGSQSAIDTLGLSSSGTFAIGGATRGGYLVYSGSNGLNVEVDYMLTGGSSNKQSDLSETIRLTNTSGTTQSYRFYQYSNFNLSGGSDSVQFPNANTVNQVGGILPLQTVVAPTPTRHEGALFNSTLTQLTSGSAYQLNNLPTIGDGPVGPGNTTWAYQWGDAINPITLTNGQSYIISNDQHIDPGTPVPEPATPALFAAAGLGLMGVRLRKQWVQ
jgi:hypothetical protein